jgi:hypothetical protein
MQSCIGTVATDVNSVVSQVRELKTNVANLTNSTTERFKAVEGSIGETHEKLEDINVRLTKVETGKEKPSFNTGAASSGGDLPTASSAVPVWVDDFLRPGDPSVIRINVDKRNKACMESVKGIVDTFLDECGWDKDIYKLEGQKLDSYFRVKFDGPGDVAANRVKTVMSKLKVNGEWRKLHAAGPSDEQYQIFFNTEVSKKASKTAGATRRCANYFKQKYPNLAEKVRAVPSLGRVLVDNGLAITLECSREEVQCRWTKGFAAKNNIDKDEFNSGFYSTENVQYSS